MFLPASVQISLWIFRLLSDCYPALQNLNNLQKVTILTSLKWNKVTSANFIYTMLLQYYYVFVEMNKLKVVSCEKGYFLYLFVPLWLYG